jgi:hypothetical protein
MNQNNLSMIRRCLGALAIVLVLSSTSACTHFPNPARDDSDVDYRGFHADLSAVGDSSDLEAMRAAIREQIDMVCAVGVPGEMQGLFQRIPILALRADVRSNFNPGSYSAETATVSFNAAILAVGHKPVLLHEFLHAFHQQSLPGGFNNRAVTTSYDRAKAAKAFPARSHMMDDAKEYFACCATTYLFGVTAQEPFRRERVRTLQPEFYEFLTALFGPAAGQYVGTLEHP